MSREWLIDVGTLAAAVTAVCTLAGVLARSRIGRWLAASITEDLRDRRRSEMCELLEPVRADLAAVKAEVTFNGGGSLKDMLRDHLNDETIHRPRAAPHRAGWQGP